MSKKTKSYILGVIVYLMLGVGGILMFLPFAWMISTSLKTAAQIFIFPPQWIPKPLIWDNFVGIWKQQPFHLFLINSAKISILVVIGQVLTCSMAAYAFARVKFPGRNVIFIIVLSTLMLPFAVTMIPVYIIMRYLGWINTHLPLIIPFWGGGAFGTFLLRQYFLQFPTDLDDAAKIDGCSPVQIYGKIYLPLAKPALITLSVFWLMWKWNELMAPLIYLSSTKKMTVALALAFTKGEYWMDVGGLVAISLVSLIPIVVVFLCAQRYFVRGIVLTGIKG